MRCKQVNLSVGFEANARNSPSVAERLNGIQLSWSHSHTEELQLSVLHILHTDAHILRAGV